MASPSDRWTISRAALQSLLDRLGQDGADGAAEYERVRRKLIGFLELRGSLAPEATADETLDRVARKLEEGERVESMRAYVFGVARYVLLEEQRRGMREGAARRAWALLEADQRDAAAERRLRCLEGCLGRLPAESRDLVERYHGHSGPVDRVELAHRFGTTPGALRVKMHRLRNQLGACLGRCLEDA